MSPKLAHSPPIEATSPGKFKTLVLKFFDYDAGPKA